MTDATRRCRICDGSLDLVLDLGSTPLANALTSTQAEALALPRHPLMLCACTDCGLVQLGVAMTSESLFSTYLYLTPRSTLLEAHYRHVLGTLEGFPGVLGPGRRAVEMGSNTGDFLAALQPHVGTVLGVEPASNVAALARDRFGIPTRADFFVPSVAGDIATTEGPADLIAARHCFAHIDNIHDVVEGVSRLLAPEGIFYIENAWLLDTLVGVQFDQVYHEHMSYLHVAPLQRLLEAHGLRVVHVDHRPVHGGSILVYAARQGSGHRVQPSVDHFLLRERELLAGGALLNFADRSVALRDAIRAAVLRRVERGEVVDTYGATAKGNTLLNYCGLDHTVLRRSYDGTAIKQGRFLPGSGLPVVAEETLAVDPPAACLLTAWNFADEIVARQQAWLQAGGRFIVPVPRVHERSA
jgi:novobiocin biosynthesis protein NovU/D-mycarose 3-C-methyltransferase